MARLPDERVIECGPVPAIADPGRIECHHRRGRCTPVALVDEAMSERTPVTLNFLARQQDRMLAELASLRDDVNVLTAILQRLDNSCTRLLAEIRATHSLG